MTNQTPESNDVNALLQKGISEARNKNKEEARKYLQRVVQLDPQNEKGWFWLASVIDSDADRMTCLQNVVLINPNNERAFQILEKLEAKAKTLGTASAPSKLQAVAQQGDDTDTEEAEGATPPSDSLDDLLGSVSATKSSDAKQSPQDMLKDLMAKLDDPEFTILNLDHKNSRYAVLGGGIAFIFFCLIFCLLLATGGGDEPPQTANNNNNGGPSNTAVQPTTDPSNGGDVQATDAATLPPTLPPTFTPIPSPTDTATPEQLAQPPVDAIGRIVMRSGAVAGDAEHQPITLIEPASLLRTNAAAPNTRGRYASASPDGTRYIYVEYDSSLRRYSAKVANINGTNPEDFNDMMGSNYRVQNINYPVWSPSNTMIAFTGDTKLGEGNGQNLFVYFLDQSGGEIQREVPLDYDIRWLGWSPDASRIVFVADLTFTGETGTDLHVYEIGNGNVSRITFNLATIIETAPDWSHDNTRIAFSGTRNDKPGSDIYVVPADGTSEPTLLIDFGPNDISPRWSPDDRYVAFASDRDGKWNVYLYDIANDKYYAVTTDPQAWNVVSDWIR